MTPPSSPTTSGPGVVCETLAPDPASVGRARRLITGAIASTGQDALAEVATLLVSEIVTNSVLHAGTEIQLRCRQSGEGIRVEVFDSSPLLPSVRHYDPAAMTGRGLALVSALASNWGVERESGGKTVWFQLGEAAVSEVQAPPVSADADDAAEAADVTEAAGAAGVIGAAGFPVWLRGASPALLRAVIAQGDALLRELALLALGGELDDELPEGWHLPQFDVLPILAAAEDPAAAEQDQADLELRLPAGADAMALDRLRLIDHADALAGEEKLLTAPALPEVAVCRHWLYQQIADQAKGRAPHPWGLPDPLAPVRAAARLPADELVRLKATTSATIVADDGNQIIFLTRAASDLLGWEPDELVGERLTVVIPPELREAHLAGFSRVQVTGVPHILGKKVLLPALRKDGSRIEVELVVEQISGRNGRIAFRAVMEPQGAADAKNPGSE